MYNAKIEEHDGFAHLIVRDGVTSDGEVLFCTPLTFDAAYELHRGLGNIPVASLMTPKEFEDYTK